LPAGQIGTQVVGRPELMGGIGFVDAEGRFDLMTNGQMGAYVGRHKVMVLLMSGVPPRSLLPAEYGTASTTPLEMNVTGDPEQNQFEFHLTGERALPTAKPAPSMPYPGPRGGTGTRGRDEPAATDEDVGNP
jgi:hypothetical protein